MDLLSSIKIAGLLVEQALPILFDITRNAEFEFDIPLFEPADRLQVVPYCIPRPASCRSCVLSLADSLHGPDWRRIHFVAGAANVEERVQFILISAIQFRNKLTFSKFFSHQVVVRQLQRIWQLYQSLNELRLLNLEHWFCCRKPLVLL